MAIWTKFLAGIDANNPAPSLADIKSRLEALEGINHDAYIAADSALETSLKKYVDDATKGIATEGAMTLLSGRVTDLENNKAEKSYVDDTFVTIASLSDEASKENGTNVKVTVKTQGGKVSGVTVDETQLGAALNLKANAADVYTKTEAETMAQGKVDALANNAVKANTEAIAKLNGNDTVEGSVDKKIKDAINAFAGSADGDNAIENVTELLNYVSGVDGSKDLASAIAQIADNKGKIETLNGDDKTAGSVAKAIADEFARAEDAYAVKGTEGVASGAAARAEEAYTLAGQKVDAAGAKAQAVDAIAAISEASVSDSDNSYVKATVTTKSGSVTAVVVDDSGVKTYADSAASNAKDDAIAAAEAMWAWYYPEGE